MGEQGTIRLRARTFHLVDGARGLLVVVEDTGSGIPDARADDIWVPFFTTKGKKGSGLGLPIARQILDDHYGRIWYERSQAEFGSRFFVALRLATETEQTQQLTPDGRLVVLVDDEETVLESFSRGVAEAGYRVQAFSTGEAARAYLLNHQPDILVTDVVMPGLTGLELAETCRQLHPQVPILLVSGYIPTNSLIAHQDYARLDKPVRIQRLVLTIGQQIARAERAREGFPTGNLPGVFRSFDHLTSRLLDM